MGSEVKVEARKDNISYLLLFPCLQIKKELTAQFAEFGFVNTYLSWDKASYGYSVIYAVFKSPFTLAFYNFVLQMEKSQNFIETVDVPDAVVLVYRIPEKFRMDFRRFCDGRYSKLSPEFKACFQMRKYTMDSTGKLLKDQQGKYLTEHTMFYHIFNRTDELKQKWAELIGDDVELTGELYDKCDMSKETLEL